MDVEFKIDEAIATLDNDGWHAESAPALALLLNSLQRHPDEAQYYPTNWYRAGQRAKLYFPVGQLRYLSPVPPGDVINYGVGLPPKTTKHLQGKHDQAKHGLRGGSQSGERDLTSLYFGARIASTSEFITIHASARTLSRITKSVQDLEAAGISVDGIVDSLTFSHKESGLTSKVLTITDEIEGLAISGAIYSESGKQSGYFFRNVNIQDGKPHVHNDYFELDLNSQGNGFGTAFYRNSEQGYKEAGISVVTLTANITVGGYAWARLGFKFANGNVATLRNLAADYQWQAEARLHPEHFVDGEPPSFPTPKTPRNVGGASGYNWESWELASLRAPWDTPGSNGIGKRAMLGKEKSWKAVKYLDPNDEGYRVGEIYYQEKDRVATKHYQGRHDQQTHGNRRADARPLTEDREEFFLELAVGKTSSNLIWRGEVERKRDAASESDAAEIAYAAYRFEQDHGVDLMGVINGMNYIDPVSGLTAGADGLMIGKYSEKLMVMGTVYDDVGNEVGIFTRTFEDGSGEASVHHDRFELVKGYQGSGFGARFYEHSEEAYKANGIKTVATLANITVGSYAWAKMGFRFSTAEGRDKRNEKARRMWEMEAEMAGDNTPFPEQQAMRNIGGSLTRLFESWELAALRAPWDKPGEFGIGKRSLIGEGNDWDAIKRLDEGDLGYQVGQAYYRARADQAATKTFKHLGGRHNQKKHGNRGELTDGVIQLVLRADRDPAANRQPVGEIVKKYIGIDAAEFVNDAWADFSYAGLTAKVRSVQVNIYESESNASMLVAGDLYDSEGNAAGEFDRSLMRRKDGTLYVSHDGFYVVEKYREHGFGTAFYQHSEQAYEKHGVHDVILEANLNVGGYAWARAGFKTGAVKTNTLNAKFQRAWEDRGWKWPFDRTLEVYELASISSPWDNEETRVARSLLLREKWEGQKILDPSDQGYQVGQLYYQQRENAAKTVKHYQGRHDQSAHGNRGGVQSSGDSVWTGTARAGAVSMGQTNTKAEAARQRILEISATIQLPAENPQKVELVKDINLHTSLDELANDIYKAKTSGHPAHKRLAQLDSDMRNNALGAIKMNAPAFNYQQYEAERRELFAELRKVVDSDPQYQEVQQKRREIEAKYGNINDAIMQLRKIEKSEFDIYEKARSEAVKKYAEVLGVSDPASVTISHRFAKGDERIDQIAAAESAFRSFVSKRVLLGDRKVSAAGKAGSRSSFGSSKNPNGISLTKNCGATSVVHELGHWLEENSPWISDVARDFLKKRRGDERTVSLNSTGGGRRFGSDERTWKDKFLDPYMGKHYSDGSTEIFSMGMELMFANPAKLASADPEYFDFIYNALRGEL